MSFANPKSSARRRLAALSALATLALATAFGAGSARAEAVTFAYANAYFACYTQAGFSDPDCTPVWAQAEAGQKADLADGVPNTAGRPLDGSPADCSFVALGNQGSSFERVHLMDYTKADGTYVQLEARKFASLDEAYALAVEHDIWPELRAYVERVKTCPAG